MKVKVFEATDDCDRRQIGEAIVDDAEFAEAEQAFCVGAHDVCVTINSGDGRLNDWPFDLLEPVD